MGEPQGSAPHAAGRVPGKVNAVFGFQVPEGVDGVWRFVLAPLLATSYLKLRFFDSAGTKAEYAYEGWS